MFGLNIVMCCGKEPELQKGGAIKRHGVRQLLNHVNVHSCNFVSFKCADFRKKVRRWKPRLLIRFFDQLANAFQKTFVPENASFWDALSNFSGFIFGA